MAAYTTEQALNSPELQQIADMFLAAGYFRARVHSLHPFDKVFHSQIMGGIAWCITQANEDITVEFSDEMPIKKKIAISESIVTALKNMDCPHRISPHQIQGLDCAKLLPICQWLVKFVLSTRSVREAKMRKQAVQNYTQIPAKRRNEAALNLSNRFFPQRKFKIVSNKKLSDPVRVYSTLLEFGDESVSAAYGMFMKNKENEGVKVEQKPNIVETKLAFQSESGEAEDSVPILDEEMKQVSIPVQEKVSGSHIAQIVGGKSEEISSAIREYEEQRKKEEETLSQQRLELEKHNIAVSQLAKEISVQRQGNEELQTQLSKLAQSREAEAESLAETLSLHRKLTESIQNIEENTEESREKLNPTALKDLETLAEKKNGLREEQKQFKEQCQSELTQLNQLKESDMIDPETKLWFEKIDKAHEDVSARYQHARLILAEKNQQVAVKQRRLENTPSKTELTQYQKRFVELYEKINLKLEEHRKFFSNYNSLLELKALIENQTNLLTSFQSGFKTNKSKSQKETFAKNVQEAISQLSENRTRANRKLEELKQDLADSEKTFTDLQEQERIYYQTLKEFQELMGAE